MGKLSNNEDQMPLNAKTPRREGNQKEVLCAFAYDLLGILKTEETMESLNAKVLRRKETQEWFTLRHCVPRPDPRGRALR
jgi:hypothetical protein